MACSTLCVMGSKNVWEDAKAEMQLSVQEVCDSEDYKALQAAGGEISFHQYEAIAAKLRIRFEERLKYLRSCGGALH